MRAAGDVLIVAGAVLVAIAAVGLHRFSDLYGRLHGASKAASSGFLLIAAGALVHLEGAAARVELVVAALLLVVTTPVGAHVLARAAHRAGDPAPRDLALDELTERRRERGPGAGPSGPAH
jgi:multicomponent Na+:H+ antiporter subunit G